MVKHDGGDNGAGVSPCRTPLVTSPISFSLSDETTLSRVLVYIGSIAHRSVGGMPQALSILIISPLCMVSKALLKSLEIMTAGR